MTSKTTRAAANTTHVTQHTPHFSFQEWQNSIQKNAGLAFIELINEGRYVSICMSVCLSVPVSFLPSFIIPSFICLLIYGMSVAPLLSEGVPRKFGKGNAGSNLELTRK